jgi:hypothetical protein
MKQKSLDELVKEASEVRESLNWNNAEVYIQPNPRLIESLEEYWEAMKPKTVRDVQVMALPFPSLQIPYYLWKLPPEMHRYLNTALECATSVLARKDPEAALATGVFYGLSQAMYGIKTKSGKHLMSGLVGILTHLKKLPETKEFSKRAMQSLKNYFSKPKK